MIEVKGNLWESDAVWVCITTNPIINSQGLAVMGRGCALEASQRYPQIRMQFARKLQAKGHVVQCILKDGDRLLISFPVKHHWREPADLELIRQSCRTLREQWLIHGNGCNVVIPRPGCGNGRLSWNQVRVVLQAELPEDQFQVISF